MTTNYLISVPKANDPVWTEENPGPLHLHRVGEYGTNWVYDCRSESDPMLLPEFATSTLLGSWDFTGSLLTPLNPDYYVIRPLGNEIVEGEEGFATKQLQYPYGAGWSQRKLQETPAADTLADYPADNQPIVLTFERRFDTSPGWEGWGWIATIEFSDPTRVPDARAIGIYSDSWAYQYTTGAFIWTEVEPEQEVLDEEGNPTGEVIPAVFKWQTQNPVSRVTPQPEAWYYALLFGAAQEGRMTLDANQDHRVDNFWEDNQDGTQTLSDFTLLYNKGEIVTFNNEGLIYYGS